MRNVVNMHFFFKENLVSTFSVACKQGDGKPLNIRYKDLIANFASM